jgi:monoamine oxidase
MEERILILGAGIAGLSAALEISKKKPVTIIEARDRVGGRIKTIRGHNCAALDLGAEFVHGKPPVLWRLIREAGAKTTSVSDKHWLLKDGALQEKKDFWEDLESITEQIDAHSPDLPFAKFLESAAGALSTKKLAQDYVEGFHAAPLNEVGTVALKRSEKVSEELDGQRLFHLEQGYGGLVEYVAAICRQHGVRFELNSNVSKVQWKNRDVEVFAGTQEGDRRFSGTAAVVTLPLAVLQSNAIEFHPQLGEKSEMIHSLSCGQVTKVVLQFRSRFWPEKDFGFVHSSDNWFPTCWTDERADVLTTWAGGSKGEALAAESEEFIVHRALESISKNFDVSLSRVQQSLIKAYTHNWKKDSWTGMAYSFAPPRASDVPDKLGEPLEETLYFAGEATDRHYQLGTVHGALESGLRAASELLSQL